MSDPLNFYAIEEVRKAVRRKVVPVLATKDAIEHSIQILYGNEGAARAIEEMRREAGAAETAPEADTAFTSNQLGDDSVSSAPTIRLVNSIIERAVLERASDIHLSSAPVIFTSSRMRPSFWFACASTASCRTF